jgi:hypothetical protein
VTALRALALASLALLSTGCWTGYLYQVSRVRESVVDYSAAWTDGQRLVLAYDVVVSNASGEPIATEPRLVELRVDDLTAHPELPVDAFPVVVLAPPSRPALDDREVPILPPTDARLHPLASSDVEGATAWLLVEGAQEGRLESLDLFAIDAHGAAPDRVGRLYSDALYRERTAWWAYACFPVAGALDVALAPLQLATAWPFLVFGP